MYLSAGPGRRIPGRTRIDGGGPATRYAENFEFDAWPVRPWAVRFADSDVGDGPPTAGTAVIWRKFDGWRQTYVASSSG